MNKWAQGRGTAVALLVHSVVLFFDAVKKHVIEDDEERRAVLLAQLCRERNESLGSGLALDDAVWEVTAWRNGAYVMNAKALATVLDQSYPADPAWRQARMRIVTGGGLIVDVDDGTHCPRLGHPFRKVFGEIPARVPGVVLIKLVIGAPGTRAQVAERAIYRNLIRLDPQFSINSMREVLSAPRPTSD